MGVTIKNTRVALNISTGTQNITIPDFGTPKAALLILTKATTDGVAADDALFCWGITDGTRVRTIGLYDDHGQATQESRQWYSTSNIIDGRDEAGTQFVLASFVSWITDGLQINISIAPAGAWLLTVTLFGGTDLSAYVNHFELSTVDTAIDVTAPGFEPHVLITALYGGGIGGGSNVSVFDSFGMVHNDGAGGVTQRSVAILRQDGVGDSADGLRIEDSGGLLRSQVSPMATVLYYVEYGSFDSSGFSATPRTSTQIGADCVYLALKLASGANAKVWLHSTPTSTGETTDTTPNFQPQWVYAINTFAQAVDTAYSDANAGSFGMSVMDSAAQFSMSANSENAAATMNTQSLSDNVAIELPDHVGGAGLTASLVEFTATGIKFNYTNVEAAAKLLLMLAIKSDAAAAVTRKFQRASVLGV